VKSLVGESEQSPRRQEALFAAMVRNASRVTGCFRLPSEEVVEIGRQISIKKYAILNRGAKVRPQRAQSHRIAPALSRLIGPHPVSTGQVA
jgi:hypothetical protein